MASKAAILRELRYWGWSLVAVCVAIGMLLLEVLFIGAVIGGILDIIISVFR